MPKNHPVKVELAKRGQSQREFAPTVGVTPGTLNLVLNGHVSSWPALRLRTADELGLPEATLFPEVAA